MINLRKVFVINKSSHDYSKAEEFGQLIFMTEGSLNRFAVSKMFRTFEPFIGESQPTDYLLLSGLSVMCSVASAMFAAKHQRLNLLIYKPDRYDPGTYREHIVVMGRGG